MIKNLSIFLISFFLILGCSDSENSSKNSSDSKIKSQDTSTIVIEDNHERIKKKYGEQWDFCDCVKKNDSIDKLLKNQTLSDSELDKVLKRADVVENNCKILLTDLKSNKPSDRQRHQEKVKACLEN